MSDHSDGTTFQNTGSSLQKESTLSGEGRKRHSLKQNTPNPCHARYSELSSPALDRLFGRWELFPNCSLVHRHVQGGILSCVLQLLDQMLLLSLEAYSQLHSYLRLRVYHRRHGRGITADVDTLTSHEYTPE